MRLALHSLLVQFELENKEINIDLSYGTPIKLIKWLASSSKPFSNIIKRKFITREV